MIRRTFTLSLPDGERIRGELRLRDGASPTSAIVVVHGFKGFKDWGFFPHTCEALASDGHAVVSFDFSLNGIGKIPGQFTRLEAFARNHLTRELDEVLRVVRRFEGGDLLQNPVRRIGLLGHSRGGGIAVLAAREAGSRVSALVTWAAVSTFDRWTEGTKTEWRSAGRIHTLNARTGQEMPLDVQLLEDFETHRERLDVEAAMAELSVPALVVHGDADEAVSVEDARRLGRANPAAELRIISGAGHTFQASHPFAGPTPELEQALEATRDHFRRHLSGTGEPGSSDPGDR